MKNATHRFFNPILQMLRKPCLSRTVKISLGKSGLFKVHPLFKNASYERMVAGYNPCLAIWFSLCAGKNVVFDVGAHVGAYTLPASRAVAPGGTVYAFEPSERTGRFLLKHCRYNRITNVRLVPWLVGEEEASAVAFYENSGDSSRNSILQTNPPIGYRKTLKRQIGLDDFCRDHRVFPEIMKIDVEGAEVDVLRGAIQLLKAHRPILVLSVHPNRLSALGHSTQDVSSLMEECGYQAFDAMGQLAENLQFNEYLWIPLEQPLRGGPRAAGRPEEPLGPVS